MGLVWKNKKMHQTDADMTTGSISGHLTRFAVSIAIGLLFQQLYNTVDTIVVGQFVGKEALAAVGSTGSVINMLISFSNALSMGASVVIAQAWGSHDEIRVHKAVQTTVLTTFGLSVLLSVLGLLTVRPMLHLMDTPDDVMNASADYLGIYFMGLTGLLFYNMGASILRAVGDSKRPLFFLCFSAITNTVLDLVFVIALGWGVKGVAAATVLSQALSALLVCVALSRESACYAIRWRHLGIHGESLRQIISIGLPGGIQQAITGFSNVFVQAYINSFGSAFMAAWAAYNKADAFIAIPANAFSMTATTFVGQNYGAGKYARARKGVNTSLKISVSITVALSVLAVIFAKPFMRLFTNETDVLAYSILLLQYNTPLYFTVCFQNSFSGALRGIGDSKSPMVCMLLSLVLFRQIYLFAVKQLGNSMILIGICYPVGWAVCSVLLYYSFRKSVLCQRSDVQA